MIRTAETVKTGAAIPRRADLLLTRSLLGRGRLQGAVSPVVVDRIATAFQNHEGYFPGSPAWKNNNPGNLVYAGQPGATLGAGGFARFASYDLGRAALLNQINLDVSRGRDVNGNRIETLADLIRSWAPASDPRNNTPAYIAAVAGETGFDPNASFDSLGDGVPVFSVTVTASGDNPDGAGAPAFASLVPPGLVDALTRPVDLSSVGAGSVPLWWLLVAGLAVAAAARR